MTRLSARARADRHTERATLGVVGPLRRLLPLAAALCLVACAAEPAAPTSASADPALRTGALTAEQCDFFAVDGAVRICHRTSSNKNPYVIIRVDHAGCVQGHEDHDGDFVAYDNPDCDADGCYPVGAPLDPDGVIACCGNLEAPDGYCACPKSTACETWTWDPSSAACVSTAVIGGAEVCDDEDDDCDGSVDGCGEVECGYGMGPDGAGGCAVLCLSLEDRLLGPCLDEECATWLEPTADWIECQTDAYNAGRSAYPACERTLPCCEGNACGYTSDFCLEQWAAENSALCGQSGTFGPSPLYVEAYNVGWAEVCGPCE